MKTVKARLSKGILEMKFMKRTKAEVEKERFQEEGKEYFARQLPLSMQKESGNFIMEPSYVYCEQLTDGRVSFQGMNPEIERIMEKERNEKLQAQKVVEKTDVSEEQMAKEWASLQKKLKKGKQKQMNKRRKFLKPTGDI